MSSASATSVELKPEEIEFLNSLQPGDLVEHPKWGIGSILARNGLGELTKLIVAFPEAEGSGQKKLMASYARLRKIEDSSASEEAAKLEKEDKPVGSIDDADESDDDDEAEEDDKVLPANLEGDDEEDMPENAKAAREDDWEAEN